MPRALKVPNEIIKCACGCNGEFMRFSPQAYERRFLVGHAARGQTISPEQRMQIAASLRGKPSGMLGKRMTEESRHKLHLAFVGRPISQKQRAQLSKIVRERMRQGQWKMPARAGRGARGKRFDIGDTVFRSAWEANIARWLNRIGLEWEYEPRRFHLLKGDCYIPDFYIPSKDKFIEVKGYWWAVSLDRFARFRAEYPSVDLLLINSRTYRRLERRLRPQFPHWEISW